MRLDGTLEDYPLSDILQLIFMGERSGTLHIHSGGDEGMIVFGDNLVRFGKTKENKGLHAVKQILGWKTGKFIFDTEELEELEEDEKIDLPIQQFILGISTEMDETAVLMSKIGGLDRRLILLPVAPKGKPVTLSPLEWQIVVHIGDAPTLGELQSRVAVPEHDVLQVIVSLQERGLLTIEE